MKSIIALYLKQIVKAKIEKLAPIISKWEGKFVNDPVDKGGATNMGITIGTWKSVGYDKNKDGKIDEKDIKLLDKKDFEAVLLKYWNKWKADVKLNRDPLGFDISQLPFSDNSIDANGRFVSYNLSVNFTYDDYAQVLIFNEKSVKNLDGTEFSTERWRTSGNLEVIMEYTKTTD